MLLNVSHKQLVSRFAKQHDISSRKAENIFRSVDKNIMGFSGRKIGSEKKAKEILDKAYQAASEQGITLKGYSAGAMAQRTKFIRELKKEAALAKGPATAAKSSSAKTAAGKKAKRDFDTKEMAASAKSAPAPKDENVYKTGEYGHRQAKYTEAELKKEVLESGGRESIETPAANNPDNQKTGNKSLTFPRGILGKVRDKITEMPI